MRILLTNDDGIDAPGIAALFDAIQGLGEIRVVAPAGMQSASSHGITFYHPLMVREVQANPRFQERLKREVPLGRLVSAEEDALFAAYLCSDAAACFVGQVFPVSGGWANR